MYDDSLYPFDEPVLLNDTVFINWGGVTGSSAPATRSLAYLVSEESIARYTSILPYETTLTGSYSVTEYLNYGGVFLKWGMVSKVHYIRMVGLKGEIVLELDPTVDNVYIVDSKRGFVSFPCHGINLQNVVRIDISYDCGIPSGAADGMYYLAVSSYAQEVLNEIVGYGNEAPGMVGVEMFTNQQYSERRKELIRTSLGSSPKSNFVRQLLENGGFVVRRWVGL